MAVFDIGAGALEEAYLEFGLEAYLHQLPTVRILTVCTYMLQVLPLDELESSGVTPFFGMAQLTLRTAMLSYEQKGIQYLLRSYPCLQESEPDDVVWTPNYHCVNQTLKVVQVRGYTGTRHEIGLLMYLFCRGM